MPDGQIVYCLNIRGRLLNDTLVGQSELLRVSHSHTGEKEVMNFAASVLCSLMKCFVDCDQIVSTAVHEVLLAGTRLL